MAQIGCIVILLVVVGAVLAPLVGGVLAGVGVALILAVVIAVGGYFYLKGGTKRQVAGLLARIEAYNPQWHFESTQQPLYGGGVRFSWGVSTLVATEDGSLSAQLTESVETLADGTRREANVQAHVGNTFLFSENFLDIADNEYAIAFISSRIAAVAGDRVADPLTRCRAYLAAEAAERRRNSEIRRKYTGT